MAINYFQEDIQFKLPQKGKIKKWLKKIAIGEGFLLRDLNFIFCSDEYLYKINLDYLQHRTYTDIITFNNSEKESILEGDIFISIERVKENALSQNEEFFNEVLRVISHGLFHLCGLNDKTQEENKLMRSKEDQAILLFNSFI